MKRLERLVYGRAFVFFEDGTNLGNFCESRVSKSIVLARFGSMFGPQARRVVVAGRSRLRAVVHDAPLLFLGVVLGVAVTFRIVVGWANAAAAETIVAPTFATTASLISVETGRPPASTASPTTGLPTNRDAVTSTGAPLDAANTNRPAEAIPVTVTPSRAMPARHPQRRSRGAGVHTR